MSKSNVTSWCRDNDYILLLRNITFQNYLVWYEKVILWYSFLSIQIRMTYVDKWNVNIRITHLKVLEGLIWDFSDRIFTCFMKHACVKGLMSYLLRNSFRKKINQTPQPPKKNKKKTHTHKQLCENRVGKNLNFNFNKYLYLNWLFGLICLAVLHVPLGRAQQIKQL